MGPRPETDLPEAKHLRLTVCACCPKVDWGTKTKVKAPLPLHQGPCLLFFGLSSVTAYPPRSSLAARRLQDSLSPSIIAGSTLNTTQFPIKTQIPAVGKKDCSAITPRFTMASREQTEGSSATANGTKSGLARHAKAGKGGG